MVLNPGTAHAVEVPAKLMVTDPAAVEADGDDAALMDVAPEINKLQTRTKRLDDDVDKTEARTMENAESISSLTALVSTLVNQQTRMIAQQNVTNQKHDEVVAQMQADAAQMKADAAQQSKDIQALTAVLTAQLQLANATDGGGGGGGSGSGGQSIFCNGIGFPRVISQYEEDHWTGLYKECKHVNGGIRINGGDMKRVSRILATIEYVQSDVKFLAGGMYYSEGVDGFYANDAVFRMENLQFIGGDLEILGTYPIIGYAFPKLVHVGGSVTIGNPSSYINNHLTSIQLPALKKIDMDFSLYQLWKLTQINMTSIESIGDTFTVRKGYTRVTNGCCNHVYTYSPIDCSMFAKVKLVSARSYSYKSCSTSSVGCNNYCLV